MILSLIGCTTTVQEKQEITITANDTDGRKLMIAPMGEETEATEMVADGQTYHIGVSTSPSGFYNLISIKGQAQSIVPFYVPVTEAKAEAAVTFGERGAIGMEGSDDNRALAAYLNAYVDYNRSLFASKADFADPAVVKGFLAKADSIVNTYDCSDEVEEYLKIWSYIHTHNTYDLAKRLLKTNEGGMPYKPEEVLPEPHTVMDSPLALIVPSPYVTNNHQEKNARALEEAGGAVVLLEGECSPQKLFRETCAVLKDEQRLREMESAMASLGIRDATERIYEVIQNITK